MNDIPFSKYKSERKWILNIVSHACRTSLDYRIIEKRYAFRQLFAIYSSRLSDWDLRDQILGLFTRVCEVRYALVDLIKRHYLLVWLSGLVAAVSLGSGSHTAEMSLLGQMIQIYVRVWAALGRRASHDRDASTSPPPLTFLNQMVLLSSELVKKLDANKRRFIEIRMHEKLLVEKQAQPKTVNPTIENNIEFAN